MAYCWLWRWRKDSCGIQYWYKNKSLIYHSFIISINSIICFSNWFHSCINLISCPPVSKVNKTYFVLIICQRSGMSLECMLFLFRLNTETSCPWKSGYVLFLLAKKRCRKQQFSAKYSEEVYFTLLQSAKPNI